MTSAQDDAAPIAWKQYVFASAQFLLTFYLATFVMGYLFLHRGEHWYLAGLGFGFLYLFTIVMMAIRMIRKLSMAAIMIAAPTIPLCMMILVVSLLPIFQAMDKHKHAQDKLAGTLVTEPSLVNV